MARLIRGLDNAEFAVREKAMTDLENLADLAEPALREALAHKPPTEVRKRLNSVIEKLEGPVTDAERLRLRAVAVLGQIGSSDAQKVLEALAKGAPKARVTQEARAARKHLTARAALPRITSISTTRSREPVAPRGGSAPTGSEMRVVCWHALSIGSIEALQSGLSRFW